MMTSERFRQPTYQVRKKVFKLFGGSFDVYGPDGSLVLFASQKAFKLKEDIRLYGDKGKAEELLVIKARSIIDFSAAYDVEDPTSGQKLGAFKRKGWRSLLRDEWIVMDASDQEIGFLKEDNAMMATLRRFISLIPQNYHCEVNGGLRLYLQAKLQSVRIQAQHRIPGGFLQFRQAHGLGRRGSAICYRGQAGRRWGHRRRRLARWLRSRRLGRRSWVRIPEGPPEFPPSTCCGPRRWVDGLPSTVSGNGPCS